MNDKQKTALYLALVKLLVWKAVSGMTRNARPLDYKIHEALELLCQVVDMSDHKATFRKDVLDLASIELHNDVSSERPLDSVPF